MGYKTSQINISGRKKKYTILNRGTMRITTLSSESQGHTLPTRLDAEIGAGCNWGLSPSTALTARCCVQFMAPHRDVDA